MLVRNMVFGVMFISLLVQRSLVSKDTQFFSNRSVCSSLYCLTLLVRRLASYVRIEWCQRGTAHSDLGTDPIGVICIFDQAS